MENLIKAQKELMSDITNIIGKYNMGVEQSVALLTSTTLALLEIVATSINADKKEFVNMVLNETIKEYNTDL